MGTLLIRVNCGVQDISLYRYLWGLNNAMLDPSASPPCEALNPFDGFPLAYRDARRVSLWGHHVWCCWPKSSIGFREVGATTLFVQCFRGIKFMAKMSLLAAFYSMVLSTLA